METLQAVTAKMDWLFRLEALLFAVHDLEQDPPFSRVLADSPQHFLGHGVVVTEINGSVVDKDVIGAAGARAPIFTKLDNNFNDLDDFLSGSVAPARDNFQWHSLVHDTPFQLDGPKAMCFISETV
jgi:hypothetical protein